MLLKIWNNNAELTIESEFRRERMRMYDNDVYVHGEILNPEVIQLMTPAGIRDEHPIATLCSFAMTQAEYNMQLLKAILGYTQSLVHNDCIFYCIHPSRRTAIIVLRLFNYVVAAAEYEGGLAFIENPGTYREPRTYGLLFGTKIEKGLHGIDYLDAFVPHRPPRTITMQRRMTNDSLVGKIDQGAYFYRDNSRKAYLVSQVCDLVEQLLVANEQLIHAGGLATRIVFPNISMDYPPLFMSHLTRLVFDLSSGTIELICPEYDLNLKRFKK